MRDVSLIILTGNKMNYITKVIQHVLKHCVRMINYQESRLLIQQIYKMTYELISS